VVEVRVEARFGIYLILTGGTPPDVAITELELFALPWQPKP